VNAPGFFMALVGGLAAQLAMVLAGHYVAFVRDRLFAALGLLISLAAGLWVGLAGGDWVSVIMGGAIAGGACALVGIAVSVALKDTPPAVLLFGALGSAVAGATGAVIGRLV
jgi:hypothetical protein